MIYQSKVNKQAVVKEMTEIEVKIVRIDDPYYLFLYCSDKCQSYRLAIAPNKKEKINTSPCR